MFATLLTFLTSTLHSILAPVLAGLLNNAFAHDFFNEPSSSDVVVGQVSSASVHSPFEQDLTPISTPPERLIIPVARIDIALVPLGVDSTGRLDVPSDPSRGGWYFRSAKAGDDGTVLIDAHYDDVHGRPAAFYNLKRVTVGDKLVLVDSYGRQFPYRVTEVIYVGLDTADRVQQLSSGASGASLTLITCGGRWLSGASTYSARLIVHAVLEK